MYYYYYYYYYYYCDYYYYTGGIARSLVSVVMRVTRSGVLMLCDLLMRSTGGCYISKVSLMTISRRELRK